MMNETEYRRKVLGAWLGKAVGGTLGGPYEGRPGPLNLSFYDPVPTTMLPNDDLDLQVVWACRLATDWEGVVDRRNFEKAWLENVGFVFDEYAVCICNLRMGYHAPQTGEYDNYFVDGLGAAIRSELWACLAPGDPQLAAAYAYEDACLDHHGDGVYAEQFLAAAESYAFTDSDIAAAIQAGLAVIPAECRLAKAIRDTQAWCADDGDFWKVREKVMAAYGHENFTDVVMNVPMMVAAMLLCGGDFSKAICLAVNGGNDTDCTGATVGAFMGIRDPEGIGAEWLKPIGTSLVLSKEIVGIAPPADLDGFTDLIAELRKKATLHAPTEVLPPITRVIPARTMVADDDGGAPQEAVRLFDAAKALPAALPGNLFEVNMVGQGAGQARFYEVEVTVAEERDITVMVNSHAENAAWLDGAFLFHRAGGKMLPSFHRRHSLKDQEVTVHVTGGVHRLLFAVWNRDGRDSARLIFGVGDTVGFWIPNAC